MHTMFLWFIICYRHKPTLASDGYIRYVDDMFFKLYMKLFIWDYRTTVVLFPAISIKRETGIEVVVEFA